MTFEKNALRKKACALFLNFSRSSRARAGPIRARIWAHIYGPYGPLWTQMGPKKIPKIYKNVASIGAFKGPCTLP